MSFDSQKSPKRFAQLTQFLHQEGWKLDRISGSHHIFTKPGRRCVPVAFHGGTLSRNYANLILNQTVDIKRGEGEELPWDDSSTIATSATSASCSDHDGDIVMLDGADDISPICDHGGMHSIQENKRSSPTKSEIEESKRKELIRQSEALEFEKKKVQKQKYQQIKEEERNRILATIQNQIAKGAYEEAVDFITSNIIKNGGLNEEKSTFECDIYFYQTIALSENALANLKFNSPAQKNMIREAMKCATKFMESNPERREEGRKMTNELQSKVIASYLNALASLFKQHLEHVTGKLLELREENDDEEEEGGDEGKMSRSTIDFMMNKLGLGHSNHSQAEIDDVKMSISDGFIFLISIAEYENSLMEAMKFTMCDSAQVYNFATIALETMMDRFNSGDYEKAMVLSDDLYRFSEESFMGYFTVNAIASKQLDIGIPSEVISNLGDSFVSPKLLRAISSHIQVLHSIYGPKEFHWKRLAGLAEIAESDPSKLLQLSNDTKAEDVFHFMNSLCDELEHDCRMVPLVSSRLTWKFVADSLNDLSAMAFEITHRFFFDKEFKRHAGNSMEKIDGIASKLSGIDCQHAIDRENIAAFKLLQKPRFDGARVLIIQQLHVLLRIIDLHDKISSMDEAFEGNLSKSRNYVMYRFVVLPKAMMNTIGFMRMYFGPANDATFIVMQALHLRHGFDAADERSIHCHSSGINLRCCAETEAIKTVISAIWAFNIVFSEYGRSFLTRYVIGEELNLLRTINAVARNPLPVGAFEDVNTIESLALETVALLLEVSSVSQTDVERALEHCPLAEDGMRGKSKKRLSDKARKYHRLILRWKESINEEEVTSYLDERKELVTIMLELLKETVVKMRKVPEDLIRKMEEPGLNENQVFERVAQGCEYAKEWDMEEVQIVCHCIVGLELAGENATRFFHLATGGAFSLMLSVVNSGAAIRKEPDDYIDSKHGEVMLVRQILMRLVKGETPANDSTNIK